MKLMNEDVIALTSEKIRNKFEDNCSETDVDHIAKSVLFFLGSSFFFQLCMNTDLRPQILIHKE